MTDDRRRFAFLAFLLLGMICTAQCALAQIASTQTAPASPWYVEGSVGAFWRFDASKSTTFFNDIGTTGPGTNTATFDPGPAFNLGIGYKLPLGFRMEVEGGYTHYSDNNISPLSTNGAFPLLNGNRLGLQSGGAHNDYSATFNAFYDVPMSGWVAPYIGAGVGVDVADTQTGIFTGPGGVPRFTQNGGNATNAMVLAEVGANIALNANWTLVPSYRFQKAFTDSGSFPNNANILKLGLRYAFK